jgi:hypothetical protein
MKAGRLALAIVLGGVAAGRGADVNTGPLLVVPGAEQVQVHGSNGGALSIEFDVREPYPALKTIGFLVDTLAKRGWKIAMPGVFGPPRLTLGPGPLAEARPGFHAWEGRWRNAAGHEITYKLIYECPLEQYGMHSVFLHAFGYWYDKKKADQRETNRQREHAEFCSGLRKRNPEMAETLCGK